MDVLNSIFFYSLVSNACCKLWLNISCSSFFPFIFSCPSFTSASLNLIFAWNEIGFFWGISVIMFQAIHHPWCHVSIFYFSSLFLLFQRDFILKGYKKRSQKTHSTFWFFKNSSFSNSLLLLFLLFLRFFFCCVFTSALCKFEISGSKIKKNRNKKQQNYFDIKFRNIGKVSGI